MAQQEKKQMTYQLQAQLLINRFYEVEFNGEKMDYDTAVECAKMTAATIIESGQLHFPEDRLYWRCVLKQCDLLHSREYSLAKLASDEQKYQPESE